MRAFIFPGQGAQHQGMGAELFDAFQELTAVADDILGYSIRELCTEDPNLRLRQTKYTQSAIYVVNALAYFKALSQEAPPDVVAGHSLGEYNALLAAQVFDFETGLHLVQQRGACMARAGRGGMAAVVGVQEKKLRDILQSEGLLDLELANLNAPTQIVLSGPNSDLERVPSALARCHCDGKVLPLQVSGAFHSRFMVDAQREFAEFLKSFTFAKPQLPVIANVTARPHEHRRIKDLLAAQITHPVRWSESVLYLLEQGIEHFHEIGPGRALTNMVKRIRRHSEPPHTKPRTGRDKSNTATEFPPVRAETLGCPEYRRAYGVRYAYAVGGMVHGIHSESMVARLAKAGILGYFGTGGLSADRVEQALRRIQEELQPRQTYGMNLLSGSREQRNVELFLKYGVENIEASAFMEMTPGLVTYRLRGLSRREDGLPQVGHRVMAKLSRPEVAEKFLSPAPRRLVRQLVEAGQVTPLQGELSEAIPMADDICIEADSGGHTDMGNATVLTPTLTRLRDELTAKYGYRQKIRLGAAGGIGTPEAAATAFLAGADFILTGSINQCTVESGTSDAVKDLLETINVQDTAYAPAGDLFEIGSRVQVLRKGVLFPARANKLFDLYRMFNAIEEIDAKTRRQLQEKFFKRSFEDVFEECKQYHPPTKIAQSERNPKQKMALIFKWYFAYSNRLALQGDPHHTADFQVHCGPALGAFNQWVKGSPLQSWRQRHVDDIASRLLHATARLVNQRIAKFTQPAG